MAEDESSPKSPKPKENPENGFGRIFLEASAVILASSFIYYSLVFFFTSLAYLVDFLGFRITFGSHQLLPFWTSSMLTILDTSSATSALSLGLALLGVITNIKILLFPAQIKCFANVCALLYMIIDDKLKNPMMIIMVVCNSLGLAFLLLTSLAMVLAKYSFLEKLILTKIVDKTPEEEQAVVAGSESV